MSGMNKSFDLVRITTLLFSGEIPASDIVYGHIRKLVHYDFLCRLGSQVWVMQVDEVWVIQIDKVWVIQIGEDGSVFINRAAGLRLMKP